MNVVAHNLFAMNAVRQYKVSVDKKTKSSEKLSSGYRINRAADDAAGLSISEKMRAQIAGLNQGIENVEDGINYVKTAEGALNEIHRILDRMEELAVKSANDVNEDEDRKSIDDEIQQLKEEMGGVFERTEFNGQKIWDINNVTGIDTVKVKIVQPKAFRKALTNDILKYALPLQSIKIQVAGTDSEDLDNFGFYLVRQFPGNATSRLISWDEIDWRNCELKANDYFDESVPDVWVNRIAATVGWNAASISTLDDVASAIDGIKWTTNFIQGTGYRIQNYEINKPYSQLFSINFGSCPTLSELGFDSENTGKTFITATCIEHPEYNNLSDETGWKLKLTAENGRTFKLHYRGCRISDAYEDEDEYYGASYGLSGIIDQINDYKMNFGDIPNKLTMGFNSQEGSFDLCIDISGLSSDEEIAKRIGEVLNDTTQISFKSHSMLIDSRFTATLGSATNGEELVGSSIYKNIQVERGTHDLWIQHGPNAGDDMLLSYDCLSVIQLGLINTDVLTRETSTEALDNIQNAIKKVSEQRSVFGAYQNRMEHILDSNKVYSENLQSAESRLRDSDIAKEITLYSTHSILEQAGQSMIAQANQSQQGILQLLQ